MTLLKELKKNNIDLIRLIAPTTNKERLKSILLNASGFLYYVTITGITGQNSANIEELKKSIKLIRNQSLLPIVAGFGIKKPKDVKEICNITDGAVVGSSIVKIIEQNFIKFGFSDFHLLLAPLLLNTVFLSPRRPYSAHKMFQMIAMQGGKN